MQQMTLETVTNGYILHTEDSVLVFNKPEDITKYMMENHPVPDNVYLKTIPKDKFISSIKILRSYYGTSIYDTKQFVDKVRDNSPQRLDSLAPLVFATMINELKEINCTFSFQQG